jgi:hypothetical protein
MDKQSKFYIGEGPEASEIITEVDAGIAGEKEARLKLNDDVMAMSFSGVWVAKSFMGGTRVGGVMTTNRLTSEEERALGVKFFQRMGDASGYAYKPRLSTKAGKRLKTMIDEANKRAFDHSEHIIKRTGMDALVCSAGKLRHSVACIVNNRLFVKVPVPAGLDPDEVADKAPVPPGWLREAKESEWLAGMGR